MNLESPTAAPAAGRKRKSRPPLIAALRIVLIFVVLAAIGRFAIWPIISNTYDPGNKSSSADVAEYLQVPPPPEAHDFHVAAFHEMITRSAFIRFSAPADVCEKYAQAIVPGKTLTSVDDGQAHNDLMIIGFSAQRLPDLRWFDLPYAQSCWTMQSGKPVFQQPPDEAIHADYPDIVGAETGTGEKPTGLPYTAVSVRVDVAHGIFYAELAN